MKIKVSDYLWDYIAKLGVKHVFMFPGGGAMHLVDSLGRNTELEYVPLLHEQACAMAAETYSRIDYNLGVVLVTSGPGGTNAITGVAAAWLESTPMIVFSGQAKTADLKGDSGVRQKGNQEIGIVDIVKSITKYAVMLTDPKELRYHLDKAVYEAFHGRPGPVWIDIPLDIQAAIVETEELLPFITEEKEESIPLETIEKVLEDLQKAQRPVLIAGQGIERKNGKSIFRKLIDILNIPVLTSWIAVELLEYDHPCNLGKPGMIAGRYSNFTMQAADFILAVGTRLDPAMIGYNPQEFAPKAKKVIVDIDEKELNKFSFPIDQKIVSDGTRFLDALLQTVQHKGWELQHKTWLNRCQEWKKTYPIITKSFSQAKPGFVHPYYFIDILSDVLKEDDVIIPGSSGAGIDIFWLCIKNKKNQRMLATGSLGSMGYGIPAAIGACLASGKRTICIEGDGSLQLNVQEFASIKGRNLPIKVFVNDNNGYTSIMNMQRSHFHANFVGANSQSRLFLPNIPDVAKAYGFTTYVLDSHENIKQKLRQILDTPGPVLCSVKMQEDIPIQPKVMSKVTKDGSMRSGNLIDLWPFLEEQDLPQECLEE